MEASIAVDISRGKEFGGLRACEPEAALGGDGAKVLEGDARTASLGCRWRAWRWGWRRADSDDKRDTMQHTLSIDGN